MVIGSMTDVSIRPVASRQQQRAFLYLTKRLYRSDPHWIPPIWRSQAELVGFRKHPFWEFSSSQAFLAYRNGQPIGRILAILNQRHIDRYQAKQGFFGFFECENDPSAANALLDAAANWLREKGMEAVRGPTNPSLNYEIGTLVDGFDSPPTFMMTYNPPYHETLLTGWGLQKEQDVYAYEIDVAMLQTFDRKLLTLIEQVKERFQVSTRPLDKRNFARDIQSFIDVYNRSLENTWGYVPMSASEIEHMSKSLKLLLIPELSSIAEIDGKAVGVGFGLLDYNPLIKRIGGNLFPFGWLRILLGRKHLKRVRLISTNVVPEWQRWGIGIVIWVRVLPAALDFGVTDAELSWVLESNHLSRGTIERGGGRRTKTYRLYERSIT
jgi:GNAT superfamily N-acetyltransferase